MKNVSVRRHFCPQYHHLHFLSVRYLMNSVLNLLKSDALMNSAKSIIAGNSEDVNWDEGNSRYRLRSKREDGEINAYRLGMLMTGGWHII